MERILEYKLRLIPTSFIVLNFIESLPIKNSKLCLVLDATLLIISFSFISPVSVKNVSWIKLCTPEQAVPKEKVYMWIITLIDRKYDKVTGDNERSIPCSQGRYWKKYEWYYYLRVYFSVTGSMHIYLQISKQHHSLSIDILSQEKICCL